MSEGHPAHHVDRGDQRRDDEIPVQEMVHDLIKIAHIHTPIQSASGVLPEAFFCDASY
jgi:hypothetical protein